jgi:hypothetical protein
MHPLTKTIMATLVTLAGMSAGAKGGNAINVIAPYKHHGMWVFDDASKGLHQEPFVAGADTWIDKATANIPDAKSGFTLVFSAEAFPGHQLQLERRRPESGGTWYFSREFQTEGWLCSALFRYFEEAPPMLYVQVRPQQRE